MIPVPTATVSTPAILFVGPIATALFAAIELPVPITIPLLVVDADEDVPIATLPLPWLVVWYPIAIP